MKSGHTYLLWTFTPVHHIFAAFIIKLSEVQCCTATWLLQYLSSQNVLFVFVMAVDLLIVNVHGVGL